MVLNIYLMVRINIMQGVLALVFRTKAENPWSDSDMEADDANVQCCGITIFMVVILMIISALMVYAFTRTHIYLRYYGRIRTCYEACFRPGFYLPPPNTDVFVTFTFNDNGKRIMLSRYLGQLGHQCFEVTRISYRSVRANFSNVAACRPAIQLTISWIPEFKGMSGQTHFEYESCFNKPLS